MSCQCSFRGLLLLAALTACSAKAEKITIRADPWLPYNGIGKVDPAGYMIDFARQIAMANGHTIDYDNMPWDDALSAVRRGDYDCVVGAARDDAEDFMFPTISWGKSQNAFFGMRESTWRFHGMASLASVRLAVIDGYSYSDELDAYIDAHRDDGRVVLVKSIRRATMSAISHVATGKADVFVEDLNVMQLALVTMQMTTRVVNMGNLDEQRDLYIACTPSGSRGKALAAMFSDGLVKLRSSGAAANILAGYGMRDWSP